MMNEKQEARLQEIMRIARKLSWFYPQNSNGFISEDYPLMQGSEVEKCVCMMVDNFELERFREAAACDAVVEINKIENIQGDRMAQLRDANRQLRTQIILLTIRLEAARGQQWAQKRLTAIESGAVEVKALPVK